MKVEFAIDQKSPDMPSISLKSLWVLEADKSYDVTRGENYWAGYVALRTLQGTGTLDIDEMGRIDVTENTLLLIKYNKIKRYYCSGETWRFCWFEFNFSGNISLLPVGKIINAAPLENENEIVCSCLRSLREQDDFSRNIGASLFTVLLFNWLKNSDVVIGTAKPYAEEIRKVTLYMKENMGTCGTISDIARMVGLCEKRFRQVFMDNMGIQPKKYLEGLRMNAARELLTNTPLSIFEIANRLGFSSQFHFTREFKKRYVITPSEFRKRL